MTLHLSKSSVSWFVATMLTTGFAGSTAQAKSVAGNTVAPLPHATQVATVVVDNPSAPAAPAAPAAVVAAPTPAPVVQEPSKQKVVHAEVGESHNYMGTVALSALMGGVAGALVGGAIYFIDDGQPARNVAYWAAGGVLLGTGVGIAQIFVEESRADRAVSSLLPHDPVPTYRLALYQTRF